MKYKIGISCVGGGVGQSVVNSCRLSQLPVYTVGFDTNPFAYGAYDCDTFDYIPSVHSKNYISRLIETCKSHAIDLIIPGLDDEILMYAQNKEKFEAEGIETIVSGQELIKLCRDKEQMSIVLNRISNVFVSSYNKQTLPDDIASGRATFPLIAKPRGGSASKGITIIHNQEDLAKIGDNHIIQELAIPASDDPNYQYYNRQIEKNNNPQVSEISIQIVTDKHGNLLGKMASYNKLKDGIPVEIVPVEDSQIWKVVDELIPHFLKLGLRGPLNIQGRLTEKGFKIFEMNPRFTGITGLRALMGFNEIESCIVSWLDIKRDDISLKINHNRFGIRQTASKVVPIERNDQVTSISQKVNTKLYNNPKTILVTGASTDLGHNFMRSILEKNNYHIWALDHNKEKLKDLHPQKEVRFFDYSDLESGMLSLGNVDTLLHIGALASHCSDKQVADSLAFSSRLFTSAALHQIPAIINISSQEIYGAEHMASEDGDLIVAPQTAYAQAMYATELMLESVNKVNKQTRTTSLRLPPLADENKNLIPVEPVIKFVHKALQGKKIKPLSQPYSLKRLDIRDAANAIISVINTPERCWKPTYDIGIGAAYDISNIASVVTERIANPASGLNRPIDFDQKWYSKNSLFSQDTGWIPYHGMNNTINSLCRYFQSQKKVPTDSHTKFSKWQSPPTKKGL